MMTAYQPQPGMHPGMAPHGHPGMTQGQPMNPAQMQQMGHPGASGPGAPHVTQPGAMMGMQPGANAMGGPGGMGGQHPGQQMGGMPGQMGGQSMAGGAPNAQALSHMSPQAMMQQQHMQQQMANNPQLAMQQRQAALIQQRHMQQMQANGMAGMQQAGMQSMNPQQMQQMQQLQQNHPGIQPAVQLPQHLQMQQMQRQQAHQTQQMQQHMAMQQANSQHSNQGGQPGPPNQQGGQPQPGQMRPQSRMANPNEQSQVPQQQTPQQGQGQPQPQATPSQQQGQQPNQPQQGQQQGMNPQQMQALQQQRQRVQMQQMQQRNMQAQQMAQAQAQQQQQQQQNGQMILRFVLFADQLSQFNAANGKDISNWQNFVERHFHPEGRLVHQFVWDDQQAPSQTRTFEVLRPTIARYFQMYFDSGADSIRLHTESARETPVSQGRHQVTFANAQFTVSYPNGARLEMNGKVSVLYSATQEVEMLELSTTKTEEVVTRSEIEKLLSSWSPTMGNKQSPKMTKKNLPKAQQKLQSQFEGLTIDHFPRTPKGSMGISSRVQQFLELGETMNVMSELINYASEKQMRPEQALEALVQQYETTDRSQQQQQQQQGNPQINFPGGMQQGARTPSMANMQIPNAHFSSPNVSHLNLPMQNGMPLNGSPQITSNPGLQANMMQPNSHTPSPRQANRAAPPMIPQHSQQGTNSSAASANTSPSMNNKRRRSAVKLEGDEGGGEPGPGNRVKPSPRMTKKSKPGGA